MHIVKQRDIRPPGLVRSTSSGRRNQLDPFERKRTARLTRHDVARPVYFQ